jgi:N-acetylmuramoyl-L-alanine amidase
VKIIVLDSGHSGYESGAIAVDGIPEKTFNLALTIALREALEKYECSVILTRENDNKVPYDSLGQDLRARAQVANKAKADLFVSIHHDASGDPKARGASIYIHTNKRTPEGELRWLPAVGNHKAPRSFVIANKVQPIVEETLSALGVPWRSYPLWCADFQVLRDFNGPCFLLESFMGTNEEDVKSARKPEFIPGLAKALAKGIAQALSLPVKVTRDPNDVTILVNGVEVGCEGKLEGRKVRANVREVAQAMGARVDYSERHGVKTVDITTGHAAPVKPPTL